METSFLVITGDHYALISEKIGVSRGFAFLEVTPIDLAIGSVADALTVRFSFYERTQDKSVFMRVQHSFTLRPFSLINCFL